MPRLGQWIWATFGAGGLLALSTAAVISTPASAETKSADAADAGSGPAVIDAGSPEDAGCGDPGCAESDRPRGEGDAGVADAGKQGPDAASDEVAGDAGPTFRATQVSVVSVSFQNSEVPRAQASLERLASKELSACASENGGVEGQGSVELKFLVRARGRAEGVDVGRARNVPPAVASCLASTLSRRPVGAPSEEPVFVTVALKLVEEKSSAKGSKSVPGK